MRLLLIDPHHPFDVYASTIFSGPSHPSLTIATIAGAAKEAGHEVRVLDLRKSANPEAETLKTIAEFEPEVAGITAYTLTFLPAARLAEAVRRARPQTMLIAGGIHPSVEPEETLAKSVFDAAVIGEGEDTLREILTGVDLAAVPGLILRGESGPVRTPPRAPIANLDDLNFPAYGLFPLERYFVKQPLWKSKRIVSAETSRGCPYHCTYCTSRSVFGGHWRPKSPARIMEEIDRILALGIEEVHFQDDVFTTRIDRAKEICRAIIGSGKKIHWELTNGIRIDRVDDEFLALAARAGCYRIYYGIESGDPRVLEDVGKSIDLSLAPRVFRMTKERGIEALAFFVLGLPEDTKETLDATIRFAPTLRADYTRASILVPFPGSPIFKKWKAEGRILSEDWTRYHFHEMGSLPFRHPHLTDAEIFSAYRRFYRRFYFNPVYLFDRVKWGLRRGTLRRDFKYFVEKFLLRRRVREKK